MESEKHKSLVRELANLFTDKGFKVQAIDGVTVDSPDIVENNKNIGDGENKIPDILAYDPQNKRFIRGEAKIGNGDIESDHSITQYRLFSSRNLKGVASLLYIIVPKIEKVCLNDVIIRNLPKESWENIFLVESSNY